MARPPASTPDEAFLREVDERLREDQLLTFARKWGKWIAAAIVVGILAFAAYLLVQSNTKGTADTQGEQFDEALRAYGTADAAKSDAILGKLAANSNPGYRTAARFGQANALVDKKDLKGAAAKFAEIAKDPNVAKPMRDLALIRQTVAEFDTLKPEAVVDRLKELAVPESPWFGTAGELTAEAYLRMGKRDLAGRLFAKIAKSETAPDSMKARTAQMASLLGVEVTQEKKTQ
ncbi:tetratricopeptide repeat protein [Sphingomonas sp.]|uniref:tetratricopeptide repeat protein n=1 Tax=Sphingomonas sp. TaxID=28214 RepID=UPI0025DA6EDC|nr:tetratricopeptide repeat protein [Sphingomonas sp.]